MKLEDFLQKVKDLPTISSVASEINAAIRDERLSSAALAAIIMRDPALAASTLKLANSPFYGMSRQVSSIDRAVTIVGFETVKNLALAISVSRVFRAQDSRLFDLEGLWRHCLGTGLAAKHLTALSPLAAGEKNLPEQAFLCGILHDIGKIAFARNLPEDTAMILRQTRSGSIAQHEIEKIILGFNHQRAGQAMADAWNFPEIYQTVIRLHHSPDAAAIAEDRQLTALITAVYLGNKMAKGLGLGESTDPHQDALTGDDLRRVALDREMVLAIVPRIREEFGQCLEAWS